MLSYSVVLGASGQAEFKELVFFYLLPVHLEFILPRETNPQSSFLLSQGHSGPTSSRETTSSQLHNILTGQLQQGSSRTDVAHDYECCHPAPVPDPLFRAVLNQSCFQGDKLSRDGSTQISGVQ